MSANTSACPTVITSGDMPYRGSLPPFLEHGGRIFITVEARFCFNSAQRITPARCRIISIYGQRVRLSCADGIFNMLRRLWVAIFADRDDFFSTACAASGPFCTKGNSDKRNV
ncbi:hypothetical protein PseuLF5_05760 [Pseudomonas sp. LF-5]|uniref:hypothetical protein n=1 Tax=Pseudomonas sp. LF-5 TaxID=3031121 RepID=UPI00309617B9